MSANRYPDSSRYPRDRSPPYRDRRPSAFGSSYPPRGSEPNGRPSAEPSGFASREAPRGPKALGDAPRGPAAGPPSGAPSAPRDGRARGFTGRGEDTPLRNAPPLSSGPTAPAHNTHSSWRADRDRERDRDREFDRRERRPTPPRRSPMREARDSRDARDQRDFGPRDLDVNRARRNSRDGPPSAGSTYSDPPLGSGSTYRGSGIGRGRGGRDFAGRGRPFHPDERDRHHDARDRTWRPRSRSPPPIRRDRDIREDRRDDRELDRRDRDDRRFPREYDSYIGPAGAAKAGPRALDTHRGASSSDSRYVPGTPTGPTPHSSHHASPSDRIGPQVDAYSRRSSIAVEPPASKDTRREPGKDEALLASRAEAGRERYAPRPSSPPAAVPAFGSNVWRAPALENKPSTAAAPSIPKAVVSAPVVAPTTAPVPASPASSTNLRAASKPVVPSGLAVAPPTAPKADRIFDRPAAEAPSTDIKATSIVPPRPERPSIPASTGASNAPGPVHAVRNEPKAPPAPSLSAPQNPPPTVASTTVIAVAPFSSASSSVLAKSPPQGPAPKPRAPPTAPQAAFRPNASPQFSRAPFPPHAPRDASPSGIAPPLGPRSGSGGAAAVNTSPKTLPANIPTGPKADRTPMAQRTPAMYPPTDRPNFVAPRAPIIGGPKSMQWVRPGLIQNRPAVPAKREYPSEDRERPFGTAPKAPKLDSNTSPAQAQRTQSAKSDTPSFPKIVSEPERPRERAVSAERPMPASSKPGPIDTRRYSDVFMSEASPRMAMPLASAASSAPEALQDSEDEVDLDENDFAEIEAKYERERKVLESKRVDLNVPGLRATSPLHDLFLLQCITVDHLHAASHESEPEAEAEPESEPAAEEVAKIVEKDAAMIMDDPLPTRVHDTAIRTSNELLTPKNDASDDVDMEDKEDRSLAPATVALRLRRGVSSEQDTMPDLSTLPYLGTGPPTPLSDIEQDRPKLDDNVMLAIRKKLQENMEPQLTTNQILERYAAVYKQWRSHIRPMDEERESEDQERQPSAEPSLKATTPDITTAAMPGLLDAPLTVSGRRGHGSRWATELDFELVIKESLKTAEEERNGKKDREPRRALADPEKEAELPMELIESEAERRRYIDTNFQREPGSGIFVFHYEPPEDDFTEEEHRVMVQNYRDQYAKKWGKLAEILYKEVGTERTYKDCINHYYATKWAREYKGKARRGRGRAKRGVGRGRGAIANMDRPEAEDGLPPQVTETGRPRRSAAPTFGGMETDLDTISVTPTPGRARRQTETDGTQEKAARRGKVPKEKGSRKAKQIQIAAAPAGSPVKTDRTKDKLPDVKSEHDLAKRPLGDMQLPLQMPVNPGFIDEPMLIPGDVLGNMPMGFMERPKTQASSRPGPSSYWSVSELQDFDKNVAHFGTDWLAIANHMGTKTHTMIKNQYLRLLENGRADLEQAAKEADIRRERGDNPGPPPTPTPAPKRRYESTQATIPRQLAPNPELTKSPLLNSLSIPKTTPPHATPSSRFSAIAQAPMQGKPIVSTPGFPSMPETSLASVPSLSQQSPPVAPPRSQPQHHHSLSQSKPPLPGPKAGYFSDDLTSRLDNRPISQSAHQSSRPSQQHLPKAMLGHGNSVSQTFQGFAHPDRDSHARQDAHQEDHHQRYQHHARRISQEVHQQRHFSAGNIPSMAAPGRSNSVARSPERPALSYSHSRHTSQVHAFGHPSQESHHQGHGALPGVQQPPRSAISTPPVKEEPRNPVLSSVSLQTQSQAQPQLQYGQPPAQNAPAPPAPKPAEPRKSNLMDLLNNTEPEEPRRKKTSDQGPPSHSATPQPQLPAAVPPPSAQSMPPRRYDEPTYGRPSYAQQSSLPAGTANRAIDLTNDHPSARQSVGRESWQPRGQPSHSSQSQGPQQTPIPSHSGLPQPPFGDPSLLRGHRAVFAQHNTPRHNPSPPPTGYNSPHLHSRTPSISGAGGGPPRHSIVSASAAHHPGTPGASAHILQPNPYAQVEPPGSSVPTPGALGMRPSPHLHTSHVAQQRDMTGRNEHSQTQNAGLSYSNPQTPSEHHSHQASRSSNGLAETYRAREYDSRHHGDRDTSRELSQMLRDQVSNPGIRTPLHEDMRYQPQHHDRGHLSQRSHTPLSRTEHSQPPPLQHPPYSSLGTNNHPLYSQRPSEDALHRPYQPYNPRDRSMTERIREEQAQQQAAMNREEHMRREEDRMREQRDAQLRESLMRRDMRGPPPPGSNPPPPPPSVAQDQRHTPTGPGPMDWTRGLNERSWQR